MTLALFPGLVLAAVESTDAQNTPADMCAELGRFGVDVCTNPRSHILADRTIMLEHGQDGLSDPWTDANGGPASVWCNGPYSDPMPWCSRLRAHRGPWCSLWKFDTTTRWFAEAAAAGPPGTGRARWAPFRSRIRFERAGNVGSADFSSVLIWRDWSPSKALLRRLWSPRSER